MLSRRRQTASRSCASPAPATSSPVPSRPESLHCSRGLRRRAQACHDASIMGRASSGGDRRLTAERPKGRLALEGGGASTIEGAAGAVFLVSRVGKGGSRADFQCTGCGIICLNASGRLKWEWQLTGNSRVTHHYCYL